MSLFLEAAHGHSTSRTPIWIMRQAGRYLPEYRALKERYSFWELCRTPELACEVTLQPLRRFPLDAAILFQDIMTPLPPLGLEITFNPGPVFATTVRSASQVVALRVPAQGEIAPFVAEAIRLVREESPAPLIGFAGAPLTLATYCVQGGGSKDYAEFRQFLRQAPEVAHALLDKLAEVSTRYLRMQLEAGAQAVQLFDSWAGLHDEATYLTFGKPYAERVLHALEPYGAPRIYFAPNALHLYEAISTLSAEVIGVDWRTPLSHVRSFFPAKALQGNLDPAALLGPRELIRAEAMNVLRKGLGGPHIFNLGHGIFPQTQPDDVAFLVDIVHAFDREAVHAS
jgi:uroporphyrinogen decarboxylase